MTYDQIIRHYGSEAQVAAALGISAPSVYGWREHVPFLRQVQIEHETAGKLKAEKRKAKTLKRVAKSSGARA